MKYRVYPALENDVDSSRIWIGGSLLDVRSVVCIVNIKTQRKVYCEGLKLDKNYLNKYLAADTNKIVDSTIAVCMSLWYRKKLGIEGSNVDAELEIEVSNSWIGRIWSCLVHPQVVVRVAVLLGLLGLLLGGLSAALGVWSIFLAEKSIPH